MSQDLPGAGAPVLPPRQKKNRTGLIVGIALAAVALLVAAILVVPGWFSASNAADADSDLETLTVGTTDESAAYWPLLSDLLEEEGIELELVNFSEYPLPNPALAAGELDLNVFQHLDYLASHNVATGDDLQPVGATIIVPLPLYSDRWDSVEEIPQGAEIAVPNDPSNQGRALLVLEAAGLIELKDYEGTPTPAHVDTDTSHAIVVPIEASQTPAALQSIDGAVINGNFANDAGLNPADSIFQVSPEDPRSWPYINAIVARADDIDNPAYKKFVELYHTDDVLELVLENSKGTAVVVDLTPDEVRERLAEIEKGKRAAK